MTFLKGSGDLKYYGGLIAVVLLAYWPISFGVFSLKYDAIMYFLPWRFHISEAIQNGEFPFWSPFLYTGLPLHADMQSGAWNPLVWILSLFGRYSMLTLQIETTIYLVLAAIGFYKLTRHFQFSQATSFVCAAAYCCNGFFMDSVSIIPWITSSAYMPYVFLYFFSLLQKPQFSTAVKLSFAFALLFTASYPSYFVMTGYIVVVISLYQAFIAVRQKTVSKFLRSGGLLIVSALFTSILCLPALISYLEFFPYYSRSGGISLSDAQFNPFHIKNLISYVAPIASYKIEAGNDRLARNAYIGIFLLLFLIYSLRHKWKREQFFLLLFALIFFCFSLGAAAPLRSFLYDTIPFMDSFRHPATARIFTNSALILLAAYGIDRYMRSSDSFQKYLLITAGLMGLIIILCVFLNGEIFREGFSLNISAVKDFKDSASFSSLLLLSSVVQLASLLAYYWFLKKRKSPRFLVGVIVLNLVIFTWLAAPFNMISKLRTSTLVAFTGQYPKGFPLEALTKIVSIRIGDSLGVTDLGYPGFYEKQLIVHDRMFNPTLNDAYADMLSNQQILGGISTYPAVWFENRTPVRPLHFSANTISVETKTDSAMHLILIQQYNPNWHAYIDGNPYPHIKKSLSAYMTVGVPDGLHQVTFKYEPRSVINSSYLAIALLAILIIYLLLTEFRSSSLARPGAHARPLPARQTER